MPRHNLLLAIAAAPQAASMLGLRLGWMFAISLCAIGLWCWLNRSLAGGTCIALGAGMNMLAMAFHGGAMPIHASTLAAVGRAATPGMLLNGSKDVVVQASSLGWLADWLVVHVGAIIVVASPGDLLLAVGIFYWLLVSPSQRKDLPHAPRYTWLTLRARRAFASGTE